MDDRGLHDFGVAIGFPFEISVTIRNLTDSRFPSGCSLLELPVIGDNRGNLTAIEGLHDIPFKIARVYYLYDIPDSQVRGKHAHHRLEQAIIAVHGQFRVTLDDGRRKHTQILNRPSQALCIKELTWREIDQFSAGAVCLVLASTAYSETDYIRDYDDFLRARGLA